MLAAIEEAGRKYGLHAAPVIEGTALIQLRDTVQPKMVRGINPDLESKVSTIQQNFTNKGLRLQDGQAVLGESLAMYLGLPIGSEFLVHSPARLTGNVKWGSDGSVKVDEPDELYLPAQCRVVSYYSMGISDYDNNIIIMHQDQAAELFGMDWGSATSIQALVSEPMLVARVAEDLRVRFPQCQIVTWQEKNRVFFDTIRNEKSLMGFLMTFIVLVASFAISATLITVVVQKTREIGVMKAVGVSSFSIARIFLFQGTFIGIIGTSLGTAAGLLILHYRNAIARLLSTALNAEIFPADLYHLTSIPSLTTATDLLRIIITSMLICIFAALVPALYASAFSPAQSLRSDN
jgi:lipoprotein-releasing system permease protein